MVHIERLAYASRTARIGVFALRIPRIVQWCCFLLHTKVTRLTSTVLFQRHLNWFGGLLTLRVIALREDLLDLRQ